MAVFPAGPIPRNITPVPVFRLCRRSSAWCLSCRAHPSKHYACSGFPFMPEVIRVAVFPAEPISRSITPVPVFRLCQRSSAWLSFLPSSSLETLHLFRFSCYAGEHPRGYLSCQEHTAKKEECFEEWAGRERHHAEDLRHKRKTGTGVMFRGMGPAGKTPRG